MIAVKKLLLLCCQSNTRTGWPARAARIARLTLPTLLRVADHHLDLGDRIRHLEEHLRRRERQEHVPLS